MANQFNHSALSYPNHQTATQLVGGSSFGDSPNASGADFDTLLQLEKLQPPQLVGGSLLGDSANASYGNSPLLPTRLSGYSDPFFSDAMLSAEKSYGYDVGFLPNAFSLESMKQLYHGAPYGSAVYYGGPQSNKSKFPGTVVGTESRSNTNQFNQPLNSTLCFEQAMLNFNNLIQFPLEEFITDPEKESCMKNALSILADNFTKFPIEKRKKIAELSVEFRVFVPNWRGYYSQSQKYIQQFSAEKENIVAISGENELRVRYEELEKKEKEMITELEAVKKEKAEIDQQMKEKEQLITKIATEKLGNLCDEWATIQSFFI